MVLVPQGRPHAMEFALILSSVLLEVSDTGTPATNMTWLGDLNTWSHDISPVMYVWLHALTA